VHVVLTMLTMLTMHVVHVEGCMWAAADCGHQAGGGERL